ncbi:unnamed protein product [Parajaminaea phylloscopi]
MTPDATTSRFSLLVELPAELQCHVLTFLPSRSLFKGIARTSHYWAKLVDSHVRRSLASHFVTTDGQLPPNALVFEAQRPIDTVSHKHTLWFSHYSPGGPFSTIAHFVFAAPSTSPLAPAPAVAFAGNSNAERNDDSEARLRGVAPHLLARLRSPHQSSSVQLPVASTRPADSAGSSSTAPRTSGPRHTATVQAQSNSLARVDDMFQGLDAYDWAEPVSSEITRSRSSSRTRSRSSSAASVRARRYPLTSRRNNPAYRMQLDPLDSFETWILHLTLRRTRSVETRAQVATLRQPSILRWERRVAEGLDRVYRDWFHCDEEEPAHEGMPALANGKNHASPVASITPELLSTFGAVNSSMVAPHEMSRSASTDREAMPPLRRLEFDNVSCQLVVQPHPGAPQFAPYNRHPALLSNYSHAYLSGLSMPYSHFNASQRVELVFHVEAVEVHAGRLLGILQDVDEEEYACTTRRHGGAAQGSLRDVVVVSAASSNGIDGGTTNGMAAWFARQNRGARPYHLGANEMTLLGAI